MNNKLSLRTVNRELQIEIMQFTGIVLFFLSTTVSVIARLVIEGQQELLKSPLKDDGSDWCENPIAKAEVKFNSNVIGRAQIDFDMHSGYVNVTQHDWLFYWHMAAKNEPNAAPLIIWTNGGPGCSSMEAATTENSPLNLLDIKEHCDEDSNHQCDYTYQLSSNKYGWNTNANIVYLDQPRYVGNSGSDSEGTPVHSSTDAADDFITFYIGFLNLFPEYIGRELIIAGESYGGHYLPQFAQAILNNNEDASSSHIPLSGVIIGNGCTNDTIQNNDRYVDFLHDSNLIPSTSKPRNMVKANAEVLDYIGYTPNYYDYRLQSISCRGCFGYDYNPWSHWFIQPEIKEALNVCGNAGDDAFAGFAGGCINVAPFDVDDDFDYSGALANVLSLGIPVTLYYGKQDTACNYVGGRAMADTIPWASGKEFASLPLQPLMVAGVQIGETKTLNGLTFLQVEMAGHMVGLDNGAASAMALQTLIPTK
jgi:carboxypeptidase C (cathepsin A)